MTAGKGSPPSRAKIAAQWEALIEGRTTRAAVHAWAAPWVEIDAWAEDSMTVAGLLHLHEFAFTRGQAGSASAVHAGDGPYIYSDTYVIEQFARWQAYCREYDADPSGWPERVREESRRAVEAASQPKATGGGDAGDLNS
jgi:hypothetical protein